MSLFFSFFRSKVALAPVAPCAPLRPTVSPCISLCPLCPTVSLCVLMCPTVSPVPPCPTANLCHKSCQNLHLPLTSLLFTVNLIFSLTCFKRARDSRPLKRSQGFPKPTKVLVFWLQYKRLRLGTGLVKLGL